MHTPFSDHVTANWLGDIERDDALVSGDEAQRSAAKRSVAPYKILRVKKRSSVDL